MFYVEAGRRVGEKCVAFGRPVIAGEHFEGGGFSGAVHSQQSEALGLRNPERYVIHRHESLLLFFFAQLLFVLRPHLLLVDLI